MSLPPANTASVATAAAPLTQSINHSSATQPEPTSPLHVLMSPRSVEQSREMLLGDPRIQNDYVARRYRVYTSDNGNSSNIGAQKDLWSAVTKIERAMVECCELGEDFSHLAEGEDEELLYQGGGLLPGMERTFVELLLRHGQAPVTRSLALAILQHTIEQDELDVEEEEDKIASQEERQTDAGMEQQNGDGELTATSSSSGNPQSEKVANASAREAPKTDDGPSSEVTGVVEEEEEKLQPSRMSRFFEAGGMLLLKQWLIDCCTPGKRACAASAAKKSITKIVPSPTGPLLLPLLSILEEMPLDKRLVTNTKINKQIRNYKKRLDEAIEKRRSEHGDRQLEQWKDPIAGGFVVLDVQQAIESLMEKWQEKIRMSRMQVADPFYALRDKMRERLTMLGEFDSGKAPKPDWLTSLEESERIAKEKKLESKMSTRQLEARQRQHERTEVIQAMQHGQQELKNRMAAILEKKREESRKLKAEVIQVHQKKKAKRVRWKDGFDNSDSLRKRKLLEKVFRYPAENSGRWDDDSLLEGDQDDQANEAKGEADDAFDMFGDGVENNDEDPEIIVLDGAADEGEG